MLFNEKIDYLIKLGMKTNSNFERDFRAQMKVPILAKHKLQENECFEFRTLTDELDFIVSEVFNNEAVDIDFGVIKKFQDKEVLLHVELPNEYKIKTLEINALEDVIDTNVGVYDIMLFEFSNPSLNKEYVGQFETENVNKFYEFDFVKTKDAFYLVCKESVEDLEEELFISKTALQLTEEDLNMIIVEREKELISD